MKKFKVQSKTTTTPRLRFLPRLIKLHDLKRKVQLKELIMRIDLVKEESMVMTTTELLPSPLQRLTFKKTSKLLLKKSGWLSQEIRASPHLMANPASPEAKTRNELWLYALLK